MKGHLQAKDSRSHQQLGKKYATYYLTETSKGINTAHTLILDFWLLAEGK